MTTWKTLVSAEDLSRALDDPRVRIFDCRFDLADAGAGRALYRAVHLPGARYADLNRDLSSPPTPGSGRHPLPDPTVFAEWLRAEGVSDDSVVVAYDAGNGMFAARLWWMLRWLDHDAVAVLDGGLQRWQALGLPLSTVVAQPRRGVFTGRPRPQFVVDAATVLRAASDVGRRVLDARAPERYRGDVEPIDRIGGHVPGARNHPFAGNLGPDGRFRTSAELLEALRSSLADVAPGDAIAMCGSGVTACHLLLAMEHAGLTGARLYPGSWSEWSSDPTRPVAKGAQP